MTLSASERTFGIEIETCVPRRSAIADAKYNGPVPGMDDGWHAKDDCTIHPNDSNYTGVEVVSPILRGSSGMASVLRTMNTLRRAHARPNGSTGMHIHVGAGDLNEGQVRSVRRAFVRYENAFLLLNGSNTADRQANTRWCKLSNEWQHWNELDSDRYRSLNTTNWHQAGRCDDAGATLECRIWQSTLSDQRVTAAINMFIALVTRASHFEARTVQRIPNPRQAMREFIHNHYGKGITSLDLRVDPTAPVGGTCLFAWHEVMRGIVAAGF